MPRPQEDPDVRNSKTLAYILRHGAEKEGLYIRSDGFIKLADVVRLFFSSSFPSSARVLKLCFFDFHVFSVIASPSNRSSSYPPQKNAFSWQDQNSKAWTNLPSITSCRPTLKSDSSYFGVMIPHHLDLRRSRRRGRRRSNCRGIVRQPRQQQQQLLLLGQGLR